MELDCVVVAIETKNIVIKYIYTNKVIVVSLIKPTPNDAFKTHTLSLRILKFHYLGCILLYDGHVSFVKNIYIKIDVSFSKCSCFIIILGTLKCHLLLMGLVT